MGFKLINKCTALCLLFNTLLIPVLGQKNVFSSKAISFPTLDSKYTIEGEITFPKKVFDTTPCIILISPPFANNRHYLGLFDSIANSLCVKGFIIFRFDNRNYKYKTFGTRMSMYIQADDAYAAFKALKKDTGFAKRKIGFLGHSEGAAAVSITVADSVNTDFCILLSPVGVNGDSFSNYQYKKKIEDFPFFLPIAIKQKLIEYQRKLLTIIKEENDTAIIKKKATELTINLYRNDSDFLAEYNHTIDSLKNFWSKNVAYSFYLLHFNLIHIDTSDIENISKKIIDSTLNDGLIKLIKYNPEKYFSKIKCPILILYGSADKLCDTKSNLSNLRSILDKYNHHYFKAVIIDSLDHSFNKISTVKIGKKTYEFTHSETSSILFDEIERWMRFDYPTYTQNKAKD